MTVNDIKKILNSFVLDSPIVVENYLFNNLLYDLPPKKERVIYLVTGGVASGKSVFAYNIIKQLKLTDIPFVSNDKTYHICGFNKRPIFNDAYDDARKFTDKLIYDYIEKGQSFVLETVPSKEKKRKFLEKCIESQYHVITFFIYTNDVSINIKRSHERKDKYNHRIVTDEFVRDRYNKTIDSLKWIVKLSSETVIIDNSSLNNQEILFYKNKDKILINKLSTLEKNKPAF